MEIPETRRGCAGVVPSNRGAWFGDNECPGVSQLPGCGMGRPSFVGYCRDLSVVGGSRRLPRGAAMTQSAKTLPTILLVGERAEDIREIRQMLGGVEAEFSLRKTPDQAAESFVEQQPALVIVCQEPPHLPDQPAEAGADAPAVWEEYFGESPVIFLASDAASRDPTRLQRFDAANLDYVLRPLQKHNLLPKVRAYLNAYRSKLGLQSALEQLYERGREVQELQETFRKLAYQDPLTGLPNRLQFMDRLSHAIARADRTRSRLGVLFIDIDGFKGVNDQFGHAAGDELLREIAGRLTSAVRRADTVSRLGGDEFAVMIEQQTDAASALAVGNKICEILSWPFKLQLAPEQPLSLGCSVGVVLYPEHGRDSDSLLRAADQAMYEAKRGGKGVARLANTGGAAADEEFLGAANPGSPSLLGGLH